MTGIPNEVVERVARALYEAVPQTANLRTWESLDTKGNSRWRLAAILRAQAALSASGYVEMREALAGYLDDCDNEECERCIKARAALTIKRETGQ